MSQENVEIVRSALAALDRRDVEAYLELASPEIKLITPASPLEGPTTGHDGIRRFFGELETYAETSAFQVEEIRAVDSRVLAFFTLTALGRISALRRQCTWPVSTTSRTGSSDAPASSPIVSKPSKPWGCRSSSLTELQATGAGRQCRGGHVSPRAPPGRRRGRPQGFAPWPLRPWRMRAWAARITSGNERTNAGASGTRSSPMPIRLTGVASSWRAANEGGLALVGIQDHPSQRHFFDTWSLIPTPLAETKRISFFTDVGEPAAASAGGSASGGRL